MKKTALLTAILATASTTTFAEGFGISTTIGFESRYVFRGIEFAESSLQPAIELSYGNFYGGAWFNTPIGDDDLVATPGGEELDLYVGYSAPLSDLISVDVGVTYYTFPDLASGFFDIFEEDGDGLGANTIEAFAGLSVDGPLAPSLYVYRDFNFDTFTVEGGVSHSIVLAKKTSFDLGASLGYVLDDDAGGDYIYGVATADLSYSLTDNAALSAGVRYGGSDIAGGSLIDDSIASTTKASGFWWGLSVSSSF